MTRFILQIIANSLAIFLADYLLDGLVFTGNLMTLLITGLVLGLINAIIKPILKLISFPLIIISLGLFMIVINIMLLWLATLLVQDLHIYGIMTYFWTSIIISLTNLLFRPNKKEKL